MADQPRPTPPRWRQQRRPRGGPSTQSPASVIDAQEKGTVIDHSLGPHVQTSHQGDPVTKPRGLPQKPQGGNPRPRSENQRPNKPPVLSTPAGPVHRPGPVITDLTAQKPSQQATAQVPTDMSKTMVGLNLQPALSGGSAMLPGQRCEQDIVLAPWKLVTNYPSIYIQEVDRDEVS